MSKKKEEDKKKKVEWKPDSNITMVIKKGRDWKPDENLKMKFAETDKKKKKDTQE